MTGTTSCEPTYPMMPHIAHTPIQSIALCPAPVPVPEESEK